MGDQEEVRQQLATVLGSEQFRTAERSSRILRFLVEQTLDGNAERLKEYTIGAEALGRGEGFDPRIDSIARVEVSRLRTRLEQYYATAGLNDEIRFVLPRGSYVPLMERRPSAPARPAKRQGRWGVSVGLLLVVCCVGLLVFFTRRGGSAPKTKHAPVSLDVELLPDGEFGNVVGTQLAISPDGTMVVAVAGTREGGSELHLRRLDGSEGVRLAGTEGARGPFFSPDGEWIAYWSTGKLKKIAVRGGSPITLCDAPDLLGGSWGDDGNIVAALTTEAKLWRLAASGGKPVAVIDETPQIARFLWPQVLPGAAAVILSNVQLTPDAGSVEVLTLRDGRRRTLVRNGIFGRYLPSGHLVYVNQGSLYAQRFDLDTLQVSGSPVLAARDIEFSPTFGYAQFDVSGDGTMVYRRRGGSGQLTVEKLSRDGEAEPLGALGTWLWPSLSPDGRRVMVARMESGESRIWMLSLGEKAAPAAITPVGTGAASLWLPDGETVLFQGKGSLQWSSWRKGGEPRTLLSGGVYVPSSVSPDGKRLAYSTLHPSTHFDLWTVPLYWEGGELRAGTPEPFLRTPAVETYPKFSPDGQWMAYTSLQSGSYEVYVRPFGREGAAVQVSRTGGRLPVWLRGGREMMYETSDHRLMKVGCQVRDGVFIAGEPELWSSTRLGDTGVLPNFDAAGGNIVALLPPVGTRQKRNQVTFRFHFFDELERQLATQ